MWFTFITARLFHSLSFQPRLAATLLRSCSAVNSPTRRVGLAPTFKPASLAQALFAPVRIPFPLAVEILFVLFPNNTAQYGHSTG